MDREQDVRPLRLRRAVGQSRGPLRFAWVAAIAVLVLTQACAPTDADSELKRQSAHANNVTIFRDDFGVPHIYGKTDADAVFGLLFAQCEDDFNRVERNYIWAIGRLAEVEGEDAIYSDLRARLYMTIGEAKAAYASAPGWLKKLCDAFADGVNYFLYTHPEVEPRLLTRFEPWMPMFFFEGSIGGDIEQIPLEGIKAFYGEGSAQPGGPTSTGRQPTRAEPSGSNGFALSGEITESGNAMLLINPHTTFFFRGEVHVVSEQGLNVYGAVTWGQFFVYQGFNENNGWMHTSTGVDFIDEFVEDVSEQDGLLVYRYGDELRPVKTSELTLKYRDGERKSQRTFTIFRTHHGPITHRLDDRWVATKINWDPVNALHQSFIRTKLTSHDEFREMMNLRTNSSNNTVYADSEGNIAYYHGNFVPKRNPGFDYSQSVDGSDPDTDWQGPHAVDEIVTIVNPENGWIQNCNSTPFSAALGHSPRRGDFPAYMAPDPENFRGIHAVRVLSGQSAFTLDNLIEVAYDPYLPAFAALIPGLVSAYDASGSDSPEIAEAIEVLRSWNYRVSVDSVAMSLAHFYGSSVLAEGDNPRGLSGIDLVRYHGSESPNAERLRIFSKTLDTLIDDFGQWDVPWGEINRFQRLNGEIEQRFDDEAPSLPVGLASGRWGALASFGAKSSSNTKRLYGTSGNSFVAVVEFGDRIRAKSLLAGGQSGDPGSPHFDDQAQRYVDGQFKDVAYYRDDVERRATRRYHPGER
jgi:acyl-homoserine lactone acylase PvdQ